MSTFTRHMKLGWLIGAMVAVCVCCTAGLAADGAQLRAALNTLISPTLDESTALDVQNVTLRHADLTYTLEKGTIFFFQPITLDGVPKTYGAFFLGKARLEYAPKVAMEQSQLRRFFDSDKLSRKTEDALLLFTGSMLDTVKSAGTPAKPLEKKRRKLLEDRFKEYKDYLTIRDDYSFLFSALRNIAQPRKQPYLLLNTNVGGNDQVFYVYDPYEREEVKFHKYFKQFMVPLFMEVVCSYSIYADSTYVMLNGTDKAQIRPQHYSLVSDIDRDGMISTAATMRFMSEMTPVQLVRFTLNERLMVDSIRDNAGQPVEFVRWTNERFRHEPLLVFLPQPLNQGDTAQLTFYYHGDMIRREVVELYTDIGDNWYPVYDDGFASPATFDMQFRSPERYGLVASGRLVSHEPAGDMVTSVWATDSAVFKTSFSIGNYKRYQFTLESLPTVDVYYLEQLHRDSTDKLLSAVGRDSLNSLGIDVMGQVGSMGRNMHEQVANDIISSLQLFSQRFGALDMPRLSASEMLDTTARGFYGKRFGSQTLPGVRYSDQTARSERFSVENIGVAADTSLAEQFNRGGRDVVYEAPVFPSPSYPSLLTLRFDTFQKADRFGREARYRAHGVADQWWGQGLAPQTYHDVWLSEGLSAYSALLYVQVSRGNDQFAYWLNQHLRDLTSQTSFMLGKRQEIGALALGQRAATTLSRDDYELLVYRKGAYIFHMLRNMLLDLETLDESRFFEMLRDYYTTFKGHRVTTADFRAITEKHTGVDMGWFFDQWVYGTSLPTYKFSYKISDAPDKGYVVSIKIEQKNVPEHFKMYVPIEIEYDSGDRAYARVLVDGPLYQEDLPVFQSRPKKLRLNPFHSVLAKVEQ